MLEHLLVARLRPHNDYCKTYFAAETRQAETSESGEIEGVLIPTVDVRVC
jgi:hypothetical protein